MKRKPGLPAALLALALLWNLAACSSAGSGSGSAATAAESPAETAQAADYTPTPEAGASDADGTITLSGDTAGCDASGVTVNGSEITVTAGGAYLVTGTLSDGRIIVDAEDREVTLILSGASIACSTSSPLYIYNSAKTVVTLASGTENALSDGSAYTYGDSYSSELDEEPNACLYSKSDLVINGGGSLTVTGNFNNGITSKDTLAIENATLHVTAANHGINGKDSNTVVDASITVLCGGDAIRATNDTDGSLGWVSVTGSTLSLDAGEDGIQAETTLFMDGGSADITSGGKGIEAGGALTVAGGTFSIVSTDDAVHSNGDVTISGGSFEISAGDDAVHADANAVVSGGEIEVTQSYEGIEGNTVTISGGAIHLTASDDGLNAAGGADASGFGGFGGGDMFADDSCSVAVSGGYLVVNAGGDGIDSNGGIEMSGGTVVVFGPTDSANGALDYMSGFTLTGGLLLAQGSAGMAQSPDNPSQYVVSITFDQTLEAGTFVCLTSGDKRFVFQLQKATQNLILSAPDIAQGETYAISYGGSYSGTVTDGIGSGGTYTGGTALGDLAISALTSTYGQVGMGGSMMGGMTGSPGGWGGGVPDGNTGGAPSGTRP